MTDRTRFLRACRRVGLTDREAQVLAGIADGQTVAAVAAQERMSPQTVANHLHTARRVLRVATTAEAVTLLVEMERMS